MNILQVTPFFPPHIGGIANHVYNITVNLQKAGNDITIISPKRLTENHLKSNSNNIHIYSVYLPGWPYPTLKNFSIPIDLGITINNVIKEGKFDLVHSHGLHYPFTWRAVYSARKFGIPNVMTLHGTYSLNPYKSGGKTYLEEWFNKIFFRRLLAHTDGIIGVTQKATNHAKKFGNPNLNYMTIPNGINLLPFIENRGKRKLFRKNLGISDSNIVILFCGRFEHVKGILEFAEAARKLLLHFLNIEILIVGEGSLKQKVYELLEGHQRAHLFGWQSSDILHQFYLSSDIFAIPSRFEGLPITILEAMASTLHILYTPVGSLEETLVDYPFKTLIKESTMEEIYDGLVRIVNNNDFTPDVKYQYTNTSALDWTNVSQRVYEYYEEIIDKCH